MRNRNRFVVPIVMLFGAVLLNNSLNNAATGQKNSLHSKPNRRAIEQQILERSRNEADLRWVRENGIVDGANNVASAPRVSQPSPVTAGASPKSSAFPPPPASPGLPIGQTSWDEQSLTSQGFQTGRISGADIVHFVWTAWDRIPASADEDDRYVAYGSYTIGTATLNQGFGGFFCGLGVQARGGNINMDVGTGNEASVSCHQREDPSLPMNPWHLGFPIPGNVLHVDDGLGGYAAGGCPEVLYPRNAASRDAAFTGVRHVIAHSNVFNCSNHLLWYWRYDGATWTGPVILDSTSQLSYAIADDPNSDKLAVGLHVDDHAAMNGLNNVSYMQSISDGAGWINNTEAKTKVVLTNYSDPTGPQAWLHLSITYDNSSVLHVIFDEQQYANATKNSALRHWNSSRNTIRSIALGYWESPLLTGVFNLNLTKPTIGIGDGGTLCQGGAQSNNNYVYVSYTRFGGYTLAEQEDASLGGYYNGELWLSVSNSGGNTWAPPVNLTNTKTPNCNPGPADTISGIPLRPDSVCRSENWATIGRMVDDIDIFFVSDKDAGGIPQGEGTWQLNPVHYLRFPGGATDAQHLCPSIAPGYAAFLTSAAECEYHATPAGSNVETFVIINLGNATLSGAISVTDFLGLPTLTLNGGTGAYSIPAGSPDIVKTVTMASNGAAEGVYTGLISVTHNTVSQPSPQTYPIEFFVFNSFYCPLDEVLKTGVASPGSLALEVESNGRFASQNAEGGLWRYQDSSSTLFDGSLLVAHGSQGPDTTVFLRFFDRNSNGQYGYRAQGDLVIDTSAYGTGSGCATATAKMSTRDSVVGVTAEWYFPQNAADDELVFCRYKVYRHNPSTAVNNLALGILVDADAIPASRLGGIQPGSTNTPGLDVVRNLVWVGGTDTIGHVITGNPPNTATRYRGGVAVEGSPGTLDAIVGNSAQDLQPGGGPTDGFLYSGLQNLAGIQLYSVSDADLYIMIALDKGRSIAVGETLTYDLIYVSDTVSEVSLKAKTDIGIARAAQNAFGCSGCDCPCWADPNCDGVRSDVLDVLAAVAGAFRTCPLVTDPGCPNARTDVDANGVTSVVDITRIVNVAFRCASVASQYVNPCTSPGLYRAPEEPEPLPKQAPTFVAKASFSNSVIVESKTVAPNSTGVEVGIRITNDVPLTGILLPLELRQTVPGAYVTGSFTFDIVAASRVGSSPIGPTTGPNWPAGMRVRQYMSTPSINTCSGPAASSWCDNSASIDFVSPDATMYLGISTGGLADDIDLDPGSDPPGTGGASFQMTFNVTGIPGCIEIDTCCVSPANHLSFLIDAGAAGGGCLGALITPTFVPGCVTIGTPSNCATRSTTDPYLVTCPKGDSRFNVQLLDGSSNPIVGNSSVYLDFSACTPAELIPVPGEHPTWPIVYAAAPSDANGNLVFNVFAGGDCADCQVTINTDCGFTATVPVHSLDVNGDLCVSSIDHHSSEGICRDYNADTRINAKDFALNLAHLEHCGPAGTCDNLALQLAVFPEQHIPLGDTVTVDWTVSYTGDFGTCEVDSVVLYHFDCESEASLQWVAADNVAQNVFPAVPVTGQIKHENPDSVDFCIQARIYSPCCDSFAVTIVRVTTERICSPSDTCFGFYCTPLNYNINDVQLIPPELENEGWSFLVSEVVHPEFGPRTQTLICVGPSPVPGTTGFVVIPHTGFGSPKVYKVSVEPKPGDICGKTADCGVLVGQRVPNCVPDVIDVVCLIEYVFRAGPLPCPAESVDINCDCTPDVRDVVAEVGIVFRGQTPAPCTPFCP